MQSYLILNKYHSNYITFLPSQDNKIIENSKFIKIFYSSADVSLNGIYVKLDVNNMYTEKLYNKTLLKIKKNELRNIDAIIQLEETILHLYSITKNREYSLKTLLNNTEIIINSNLIVRNFNSTDIILKISGIWDNNYKIGITYKFIIT